MPCFEAGVNTTHRGLLPKEWQGFRFNMSGQSVAVNDTIGLPLDLGASANGPCHQPLRTGMLRRIALAVGFRGPGGGHMQTKPLERIPPSRVLLVSACGAFLAFLDATIVNVAFPSIRESFPGQSIGTLSWVLNAYNIVFAAFLIVFGRVTDLLGRRRAFGSGVA